MLVATCLRTNVKYNTGNTSGIQCTIHWYPYPIENKCLFFFYLHWQQFIWETYFLQKSVAIWNIYNHRHISYIVQATNKQFLRRWLNSQLFEGIGSSHWRAAPWSESTGLPTRSFILRKETISASMCILIFFFSTNCKLNWTEGVLLRCVIIKCAINVFFK